MQLRAGPSVCPDRGDDDQVERDSRAGSSLFSVLTLLSPDASLSRRYALCRTWEVLVTMSSGCSAIRQEPVVISTAQPGLCEPRTHAMILHS